jgi:hypothetical protein
MIGNTKARMTSVKILERKMKQKLNKSQVEQQVLPQVPKVQQLLVRRKKVIKLQLVIRPLLVEIKRLEEIRLLPVETKLEVIKQPEEIRNQLVVLEVIRLLVVTRKNEMVIMSCRMTNIIS